MIEITLKFTSVALAAAALNQLNGAQLATATVVDTGAADKVVTPPKSTKPATVASAVSAPTTEQKPAADAKPADAEKPKADAVDYPTLQKAVFKLAGISRDEAGAAAATFGVKTFKELDSAKWGEALKTVEAKIEELSAAVA